MPLTHSQVRRDILQGWDVVLVDDEPDSLEVASRILRYYKANVHTATNGKDGLTMVQHIHPKFVISDLSMPVMDGWAMLYEIQQDRFLAQIPVIALTAHAMNGDRQRALQAGFHNYLSKPLTPATFIDDLLRLLMDVPQFQSALNMDRAAFS